MYLLCITYTMTKLRQIVQSEALLSPIIPLFLSQLVPGNSPSFIDIIALYIITSIILVTIDCYVVFK